MRATAPISPFARRVALRPGAIAGWRLVGSLVAILAITGAAVAQDGAVAAPPVEEPTSETPASEEPLAAPASEKSAADAADSSDATPADDAPAPTEAEELPAAAESPDDDLPPIEDPDNPGQAQLDKALELKLTARSLKDLNEVVDYLDEALEAGLDSGNTDFAEQLLAASLMQRAQSLSAALLSNPTANPNDARWLRIWHTALTDLGRCVSLDENQLEAWMLIGRLQSLPGGNKSEARRALNRFIRLADEATDDPNADTPEPALLAQAHALRGAAQKDPADRLADFSAAIELAPEKPEYLLLRARQHQSERRIDESLEDIERALTIAPDNAKVHELKALALLMDEQIDEALESFDRASELAPKMLRPYRYRGELYRELGRLDEGIAQLDKALELAPGDIRSLLLRAQLLEANDDADKALADVEAALRQNPRLLSAHLLKSRLLVELDRTDEAIAWMERLVQAAPDQVELLMQLGLLYVDQQRAAEAIEALSGVIERQEGNALAHRLRGDMYLYAGQHKEAVADFAAALEVEPFDSGVLNNYAWTLATSPFDAVRDGAKAVELATQACEVTEYSAPHILSTLAAAHAEAGDFDQAVSRSEEAISKAEEIGTLDQYDGQLEAELDSYRSGQPWRELQEQGVSGPADEAAAALGHVVVPPEEGTTDDQTGAAEAAAEDAPGDEAIDEQPPRSFDF